MVATTSATHSIFSTMPRICLEWDNIHSLLIIIFQQYFNNQLLLIPKHTAIMDTTASKMLSPSDYGVPDWRRNAPASRPATPVSPSGNSNGNGWSQNTPVNQNTPAKQTGRFNFL